MKQLKIFVLCSIVIALLAVPFAVFASPGAPSPLFGTNFDSSFTDDHAGWYSLDSHWELQALQDKNYYAAVGVAGERSRIRHIGLYKDMVYQAKLYRVGCSYCANSLTIRASGDNGKGDWENGYHFQYTKRGFVSVWKTVNGKYTALMPWKLLKAVKHLDVNTLKVVASGSSFLFYINDVLVWMGKDTSIRTSGQVGITFYKRITPMAVSDQFYVDWARLVLASELPDASSSATELGDPEAFPMHGDVNLAPVFSRVPETTDEDETSTP